MILQDTTAAVQDSIPDLLGTVGNVLGIEVSDVAQKGLKALLILLLAWVAVRVLKLLTKRLLRHFEDDDPNVVSESEQRAKTLVQLLNSVGIVVIAIAAVLMVLNQFISIGPLLAGVGVAGLAISFGAQSLVKDVINGFFVLLEKQFDVGDVIEVNGKAGAVERMTLRVVMLRDIEGTLHIIPNGNISLVSNKTYGWARAVVDVGVAYKENVDRVRDVLKSVGQRFSEESDWQPKLLDPPDILGVQSLDDSAVVLRLMVKTVPGKQWEVKRELWRRVKNRFDAEGIEIPFPQRTLHFADKATIRMSSPERKE
jgi:small conductance mechanosensitive channel